MELGLKNKVVLVTGSSSGIGKSIAEAFQKEGSDVIINSRHKSKLENISKKMKNCDYVIGDMANKKDCKEISEYIKKKYGKLDVLVCNVGSGSLPKNSTNEYQVMFEKNFFASTNIIFSTQELLEKSKGNIICISSIAGIEKTQAPLSYGTAKAALNFFVKGISKEFGKKKIRINAVAPGNIIFQGSVWEKRMSTNPTQVKKMLKNEVSLNRLGKPEEIANVVLFLASPLASFMTGSIIVSDGGQIKS